MNFQKKANHYLAYFDITQLTICDQWLSSLCIIAWQSSVWLNKDLIGLVEEFN